MKGTYERLCVIRIPLIASVSVCVCVLVLSYLSMKERESEYVRGNTKRYTN